MSLLKIVIPFHGTRVNAISFMPTSKIRPSWHGLSQNSKSPINCCGHLLYPI